MSAGTMTPEDKQRFRDQFERFYRRYAKGAGGEEMSALLEGYPSDKQTLGVDYHVLSRFDQHLAQRTRTDPDQMLDLAQEALGLYDSPVPVDLSEAGVRLTNPEAFPGSYLVNEYSPSNHSNKLIAVEGQVTKVSKKKGKYDEIVFECQRCGVNTPIQQYGDGFQEPHECKGCERNGPFRKNERNSQDTDYQKARLHKPPEEQSGGTPQDFDLILKQGLVGALEPGDRISAIVKLERVDEDDNPTFEVRGQVHDIEHHETDYEDMEITDEDVEQIRAIERDGPMQTFVDSVLPGYMGGEHIKKGISLQLFGGEFFMGADGSTTRYAIHIALIGDPSTGKSQFLQYTTKFLVPRGVFTEGGENSTAAGLTCAAVQDDFGDGGWTLEGGALVQASGGICAIDELDKVDPEDYQSMNNAMASGQISPSKAGMSDITLPAETSVLAAANPTYERFDPHEPIGDQFEIKPSTLSRFDLIFVLKDQPDEDEDEDLADHQLDTHEATLQEQAGKDVTNSHVKPAADHEILRKYVAFAKENCQPILTDSAKAVFKEFWTTTRNQHESESDPIPVTPRDLDALVRLGRASARLRLSDQITEKDARRVVDICEHCLEQIGTDPETGMYDADVVETGTTRSQQERKKAVHDEIGKLATQNEDGAPIEDVIQNLVEEGYGAGEIESEIESLKQSGDIWVPRTDHLRTT